MPSQSNNLTPTELAERWRTSTRSLDRMRAAGTGPRWIRPTPRTIRYPIGEVEAHEADRLCGKVAA